MKSKLEYFFQSSFRLLLFPNLICGELGKAEEKQRLHILSLLYCALASFSWTLGLVILQPAASFRSRILAVLLGAALHFSVMYLVSFFMSSRLAAHLERHKALQGVSKSSAIHRLWLLSSLPWFFFLMPALLADFLESNFLLVGSCLWLFLWSLGIFTKGLEELYGLSGAQIRALFLRSLASVCFFPFVFFAWLALQLYWIVS